MLVSPVERLKHWRISLQAGHPVACLFHNPLCVGVLASKSPKLHHSISILGQITLCPLSHKYGSAWLTSIQDTRTILTNAACLCIKFPQHSLLLLLLFLSVATDFPKYGQCPTQEETSIKKIVQYAPRLINMACNFCSSFRPDFPLPHVKPTPELLRRWSPPLDQCSFLF